MTVLAANRLPPTPPPVRDAACGGGEAFPPAGVSAAADSLQELSLSGVTHVSEVPPIYLMGLLTVCIIIIIPFLAIIIRSVE